MLMKNNEEPGDENLINILFELQQRIENSKKKYDELKMVNEMS